MSPIFLPQQRRIRWSLVAAIFCVGLLLILSVNEWWYTRTFAMRIVPGVAIGSVLVGGKTVAEARAALEQAVDTIMRTGLPFAYQSKRVTIGTILSASDDPDLSYPIVVWNIERALIAARRIGHEGRFWRRWYAQTKTMIIGTRIVDRVTLQKMQVVDALRQNFGAMEEPARDAKIQIANGVVTIIPDTPGKVFDYEHAVAQMEKHLADFTVQPVTLALITDYPAVTTERAEAVRTDIAAALDVGAIQFIDGERWWKMHTEEWGAWLTLTARNGETVLTFDEDNVREGLMPIAQEIDRQARDAKFVVRNNRVVEFQTAQTGKQLSIADTVARMEKNILNDNAATIALAIETLSPNVTNDGVGNAGIVEIIGVGRSNFKGSPQNRRHNIAVGAKALHGVLIAPGEEFSLLKTLGDIDKKSGYKPELVIKGNRTIPEYGGGLCQIGTTTFRAALGSGLPITERQNHSYSVPYYLENGKPGVDATIYGPKPDFKFINDTGNPILIQTRIKSDDIIFEFWGKKDGRIAERTEPKVTNIRKPPPTKIIETEDLPPGKKKCTERAHTGATAEFMYTVTYTNGEKKEKRFRSVYRPWQEVCLVGKAENADKAPARNASRSDAGGDNADTATALPSADTAGVRGE